MLFPLSSWAVETNPKQVKIENHIKENKFY
jgi:hypothetical protein